MTWKINILSKYILFYLCLLSPLVISDIPGFAQEGSYSSMARAILDEHNNTSNEDGFAELDIFKFSVNNILNSNGDTVNNGNGDPTLFGRTDYGSEFVFSNDLSTTFSIEIPAFVINHLAEANSGEYFPVIRNGNNDLEDGTYVNSYSDDALGTQVKEYFNSDAPNKIETTYDYGSIEIEYLSDSGIDVKEQIYQDGSVYTSFFINDEMDVLASSYVGVDGYNSNYYSDEDSNYTYSTSTDTDGDTYSSYYDGEDSGYSQTVNAEGEITDSNYYETGMSLYESILETGLSEVRYNTNDTAGNYQNVVEYKDADGSISRVEYTDQDSGAAQEFFLDAVTDTGTIITSKYLSQSSQDTIIKVQEGSDVSLSYNNQEFFSYTSENKESLINRAPNVIENGEQVISNGMNTISEANSATNPNSLAIDFKELYDTEDGLTISPEMGYVRLNATDGNEYINLSNGDIVEFFVRPTDAYNENHNNENLFFINRPIPEVPMIADTLPDNSEIGEETTADTEFEETIYVGPGEEAVTLPTGEIKVYVTTVYVQAPASRFMPSQIVMPVNSDGDYNYEIAPAAAETFPDEVEVVAITDEEAEIILEKVIEIKKEKERSYNPKNDEDSPPALDPGVEVLIKLELLQKKVEKGPEKLILETKKNIQKEYPNMSKELVNLMINLANPDEKFELIKDPKKFLDDEFSRIQDLTDLNSILNTNLSQKELSKIYNLIIYKFSSDLTNLGFEILENQEVNFSVGLKSVDQILEQIQLQNDVLAIASSLRYDGDNQSLSDFLIDPIEVDPNSSTALFQSIQSQRVINQIKFFTDVINSINNTPSAINTTEGLIDSDIPLIELNVGLGESIADALQEKIAEDRRLNISFQPRSLTSRLEKFNFEIPLQDKSSTPPSSPPLLAETPNITVQELQLVNETIEATNNILDDTITRMLKELGDTPIENTDTQLVSSTDNASLSDPESTEFLQDNVFNNALLSTQRLQQVEDVRAIFEILGIGS